MAAVFPEINENFETASQGTSPEMRARYVVTAFTRSTLGSAFDLDQFQVSLSRPEEMQEYMMEIELLPDASDRDKDSFNEFGLTIAESIAAIEHAVMEGSHAPFALEVQPYTEESFVLLTPDLKDFAALYAHISGLYNMGLHDPKYCAEVGHEYSLADIEQAIALVPEGDDDEALSEMDRPVDMGLPRPWLQ